MRLCLGIGKLLSTKVALTPEAMAAQYGGVEIVNMRYELKHHGRNGPRLAALSEHCPKDLCVFFRAGKRVRSGVAAFGGREQGRHVQHGLCCGFGAQTVQGTT